MAGINNTDDLTTLVHTISDLNNKLSTTTGNLDKFAKQLSGIAAGYNNTPNSFSPTSGNALRKKADEKFIKDFSSEYDKNIKKESLTVGGAIADGIKKAGTEIVNFAVKEFKSLINTSINTYLTNYSAITARLQLSQQEYVNTFKGAAKELQNEGLARQFTTADYIDSLKNVLSTGFRGELATNKAMDDLITGKLMPAINTNSVGYREMYRKFGKQFSDSTIAFGKYTEKVLGADVYEENTFNASLDQLQGLIKGYAGGDGTLAETATNNLAFLLQSMMSAGMSSQEAQNAIFDIFSNGITSNVSYGTMMGAFDAGSLWNLLSKNPQALAGNIASFYNMGSSATTGQILGKALGTDYTFFTNAQYTGEFLSNMEKLKGYNAASAYQELVSTPLKNGYYTDSTTQIQNAITNAFDALGISSFFARIPYGSSLFNGLGGIIGGVGDTVTDIMIASRLKGLKGGGGTPVEGTPVEGTPVGGLSAGTLTGGLAVAGGLATAGWGFTEAYNDFSNGFTDAGITAGVGGTLGLTGAGLGVAALLGGSAVLGPIGIAVAALGSGAILVSKAMKQAADKTHNLDMVFSNLSESVKDNVDAWAMSTKEILGNLNESSTEADYKNALLKIGYSEQSLSGLSGNSMKNLAAAVETAANPLSLNSSTDATMDKLKSDFSGLLGKDSFEAMANKFIGILNESGEKEALRAMKIWAGSVMSEGDAAAWIKKLESKKAGGFTATNIKQAMYGNRFGNKWNAQNYTLDVGKWSSFNQAWFKDDTDVLDSDKVKAYAIATDPEVLKTLLTQYEAYKNATGDSDVQGAITSLVTDFLNKVDPEHSLQGTELGDIAQAMGTSGYLGGLSDVLSTGPYLLHKNEMVLNPAQASLVRGAGGFNAFFNLLTGKTTSEDTGVATSSANISRITEVISKQLTDITGYIAAILEGVTTIATNKGISSAGKIDTSALTDFNGGL